MPADESILKKGTNISLLLDKLSHVKLSFKAASHSFSINHRQLFLDPCHRRSGINFNTSSLINFYTFSLIKFNFNTSSLINLNSFDMISFNTFSLINVNASSPNNFHDYCNNHDISQMYARKKV